MTRRFLIFVTLGATLLVGTCAFAQKSGGKSGGKSGSKLGGSASRVNADLESLSQQLTLTEDQKTKIKPILLSQSKKLREMKKDSSLGKDDLKAERRDIRQETLLQIRPILTVEQQKKLDEMPRPNRRERIDKAAAAGQQ